MLTSEPPTVTRSPRYGLGAAGLTLLLVACSGGAFSGGSSCADGDCDPGGASGSGTLPMGGKVGSGGSSGKANSGASSGGTPASGGVAGAAGLGGSVAGSSGSGGGGSGGTGGGNDPDTFPATEVLDDFNRMGPALGIAWIGGADEYSIEEQALWCEYCTAAVLWSTPFSANQEVFAKLVHFDGDASEINLVLKAQSSPACDLIEVLYSPADGAARIAYCAEGMWTDLEATPVALEPGDRFGGRAHENGLIDIFVNDQLLTRVDASGFPFQVGRLGVNGVSGPNGNLWDDFGGGDWR